MRAQLCVASILVWIAVVCTPHVHAVRSFAIANDQFVIDGVPTRLISGSLHYARVPPQYWRDRLLRLKAMGLNAIQTVIPWNVHEPTRGDYRFDGQADVVKFFQTAADVGMYVLARPGPYICAEWEFGGFPAYLLTVPGIQLRTSNAAYLAEVDRFWNVLLPKLKPLLYNNGGPILMVQMENEYGSYGDDHVYMQHLTDVARRILGTDTQLYTTDGNSDYFLSRGSLGNSNVYAVVDFGPGSDIAGSFALQKKYNLAGRSPAFCSEFYTGWLTHWGEKIANTSTNELVSSLGQLLAYPNASVNFYMGAGGSNFGWMNGANTGSSTNDYQPHITSYDYDSPVSEGGDHNRGSDGIDKFSVLLSLIKRYVTYPIPAEPAPIAKAAYGQVYLTQGVSLMSSLSKLCPTPISSVNPKSMEQFGQAYGFIMYQTFIPGLTNSSDTVDLGIHELRDRANIIVDGSVQRVMYRPAPMDQPINIKAGGSQLSILVENMGRINYGPYMFDPKGITTNVTIEGKAVTGWQVYTLPMDYAQVSQLSWQPIVTTSGEPSFVRGTWNIIDPLTSDTYLLLEVWQKCHVYINGINIGRYWWTGPQRTLYIPAPYLRSGSNEIIIWSEGGIPSRPYVEFVAEPLWA